MESQTAYQQHALYKRLRFANQNNISSLTAELARTFLGSHYLNLGKSAPELN